LPVVRLIPKPERERTGLIRKARAIYDGIFPQAEPVNEQQKKEAAGRRDEVLSA